VRFKAIGSALAGLALVCACGSGSGSGTTSGGPQLEALNKKVDVTFWDGISGAPLTALKASADQFNASQSKVTVHIVDKGDYTALRQATLTSLAAGSPPDMAQCYENWAAKYIQSNALADLQPYMDAKDGLTAADKKDIFPILLQDGQLNGKQYMFPFNKSTTVVYYNADLLKSKGINNPPATWDELFTDAKAVADKNAGIFGVAAPAFDTWTSMLYEYGGTLYDNDKSPKKAAFNGAVGQQITQKFRDGVADGSVKVVGGPGPVPERQERLLRRVDRELHVHQGPYRHQVQVRRGAIPGRPQGHQGRALRHQRVRVLQGFPGRPARGVPVPEVVHRQGPAGDVVEEQRLHARPPVGL
jgi:multiple sugar transport system substrate-binding protein